jgi:hypothetical protein
VVTADVTNNNNVVITNDKKQTYLWNNKNWTSVTANSYDFTTISAADVTGKIKLAGVNEWGQPVRGEFPSDKFEILSAWSLNPRQVIWYFK